MDNTPEMASRSAPPVSAATSLVGLNTTRRGEALLADIRKADCQVAGHRRRACCPLLEGLDLAGVAAS